MSETKAATSAMAHGLDGSLVEPDWPPLALDEVRSLLAGYPRFEGPFELLSHSPRPLSAASVVLTRNERIFVKRHARVVRNVEGLREEHRFMAHLAAHGIAVPRVFANAQDESAVEDGEWTYEVHSIPNGIDLYGDAISWTPFHSVAQARSAGVALARVHLAAAGFDAPPRTLRPLVAGFSIFAANDPAAAWDEYVAPRQALQSYLERSGCGDEVLDLLALFHAELLPLLPALLPLWTHNDLHPSNLFWSDESLDAQAVAVIDFGLSDRANAVHDIAHAVERSIVEWLVLVNDPARPEAVPVHLDHLFALVEGYELVRPLSREERLALAPMLALCHAEFALSETDYFLTALKSEEKAWYACEGWLLGHARWWRGAGAEVLSTLRKWAEMRGRETAA